MFFVVKVKGLTKVITSEGGQVRNQLQSSELIDLQSASLSCSQWRKNYIEMSRWYIFVFRNKINTFRVSSLELSLYMMNVLQDSLKTCHFDRRINLIDSYCDDLEKESEFQNPESGLYMDNALLIKRTSNNAN